MASPARGPIPETQEEKAMRLDWRAAAVLAAQLAAFVYGYGQLKEKVDNLHERVIVIEQDVRAIRSSK